MPDFSKAARAQMSKIRSDEKERGTRRVVKFGGSAVVGGIVSVAFDQRFAANKIGKVDVRYILALLGLVFAPAGEKGDMVRGFSLGLVLPEAFQEGAQIVRRTGLPNAMNSPALENNAAGAATGGGTPGSAGMIGTPAEAQPAGIGGAPGV